SPSSSFPPVSAHRASAHTHGRADSTRSRCGRASLRVVMLAGSRETERLLLRPWSERDGEDLQRLFADPAGRGRRDLTPDRIARLAESSVRQWRVNGFGPWAALDKTTSAWIGRIGLDELDDWPGHDRIEVGFELLRAWWGRGLATEGARAAVSFGFEQ